MMAVHGQAMMAVHGQLAWAAGLICMRHVDHRMPTTCVARVHAPAMVDVVLFDLQLRGRPCARGAERGASSPGGAAHAAAAAERSRPNAVLSVKGWSWEQHLSASRDANNPSTVEPSKWKSSVVANGFLHATNQEQPHNGSVCLTTLMCCHD